MAARPRTLRKKGFPDNVYERRGGYFTYRNPLDGVEFGLGRDRAKAFAEARAANNHVAQVRNETTLIDRITGAADTVSDWLDRFDKEFIQKRKYKAKTVNQKQRQLERVRELIGDRVIKRVDTKVISDVIDENWVNKGKQSMATAMRYFLFDVFDRAEAKGVIEPNTNPVRLVEVETPEVQRARLVLDTFKTIYAKAKEMVVAGELEQWAVNGMELAIVSAQRGGDLAALEFKKHVRDESLWVEQIKGRNPSRVCIPLSLRLNAVNLSVGEVVKRCRGSGVVSNYLLHHITHGGNFKPGNRIYYATISKKFALARDATGLKWPGKMPPSFHEIRSLAERLYADQGVDTTPLLGHKHKRTTDVYHDSRGAEWMVVKA